MKTVSTLCATGTLGVAATGLAFGVPLTEQYGVLDLKRRESGEELQLFSQVEHIIDSETTTSSRQATPVSSNVTEEQPTTGTLPRKGFVGSGLNSRDGFSRRFNPDINVPKFYKSSIESPTSDESNSPQNLQRRPSRLKRLSSFTLSGNSTSPPSSQRPVSRSFTLSSSSTAPMLPGGTFPTQLPPNKLVKRSLSQQKAGHLSPHSASTRKPTFKRPATSHQRSFELSKHSGEAEFTGARPRTQHSTLQDGNGTYSKSHDFYFVPRFSKENALTTPKTKRVHNGLGTIRRIYPKGKRTPLLLSGGSVRSAEVETDTTLEVERQPFFFGSRPHTPSDLKNFFSSPSSAPALVSDSENQLNSPPRRSFSFGDLMSHGGLAWRPPNLVKSANGRLRRLKSNRVSSAPAKTGVRDNPPPLDDFERPSKRREIAGSSSNQPSPYANSHWSNNENSVVSSDNHPPENIEWSNKLPNPANQREHPSPAVRESLSPSEYATGKGRSSPSSNVSFSSTGIANSTSRHSRHSMTTSEITSDHPGSEADGRIFSSGDEDDGDLRSDTMYDSMRTGITRSSSGYQGLKLETLFDRDASNHERNSSGSSGVLRTAPDLAGTRLATGSNIITEEEESSTTPVRTIVPEDRDSNSRRRSSQTSRNNSHASPTQSQSLSLGKLEWDSELDEETSMWSVDENIDKKYDDKPVSHPAFDLPKQTKVSAEATEGNVERTLNRGPLRNVFQGQTDQDTKNNLFDWSEDQPMDRGSTNQSPPRPKTVHGKKDMDSRVARSAGRIPPSAVHGRSQSVPVAPDLASKRASVMNKFGTWGIGSKGVAEDWNEDFDFNFTEDFGNLQIKDQEPKQEALSEVFVPESIRVQQNNVLANISLLKDWGVMIEQLKDLRLRATMLDVITAENSGLFDEVDAMIDLADQEVEEDILSKRSIASSPGFDLESKPQGSKGSPNVVNSKATVTSARDDVFAPEQQDGKLGGSSAADESQSPSIVTGRPRKNSEAVAKSVIETLQKRRNTVEQLTQGTGRIDNEKVPFDTATLKHIVPHVNGLMRKVKRILHDTEGLDTSPEEISTPADENLRRTFESPSEESPTTQRDKRRKRY